MNTADKIIGSRAARLDWTPAIASTALVIVVVTCYVIVVTWLG